MLTIYLQHKLMLNVHIMCGLTGNIYYFNADMQLWTCKSPWATYKLLHSHECIVFVSTIPMSVLCVTCKSTASTHNVTLAVL